MEFGSIFDAHAAFVATVVPPMAVTLIIGISWKRFSSKAAVLTLVGGYIAVALSLWFPELIEPFAQGSPKGGEGMKAYKYMRAFYGLSISTIIAVVATLIFPSKSKPDEQMMAGSEERAKELFKGTKPKPSGATMLIKLEIVDSPVESEGDELLLVLHPSDRATLGVDPGDLISVSVPSPWHGGLKSVHGQVADRDGSTQGIFQFPKELERYAGFVGVENVRIEVHC